MPDGLRLGPGGDVPPPRVGRPLLRGRHRPAEGRSSGSSTSCSARTGPTPRGWPSRRRSPTTSRRCGFTDDEIRTVMRDNGRAPGRSRRRCRRDRRHRSRPRDRGPAPRSPSWCASTCSTATSSTGPACPTSSAPSAATSMPDIAIDEWMGASPVYSKRMQRALGFEGDSVETIFKNLQLDIGAPPQFMDFRFELTDRDHGRFWLDHCGALMDVEPMGHDYVQAMCHDIEDPTFDATATASNPRAQIRPVHRPPRVPADRVAPLRVDGDHRPVPPRPARCPVRRWPWRATRAATFELEPIDPDRPRAPRLLGPARSPTCASRTGRPRRSGRIAEEVCLQGHLLSLSFLAATRERTSTPTSEARELLPPPVHRRGRRGRHPPARRPRPRRRDSRRRRSGAGPQPGAAAVRVHRRHGRVGRPGLRPHRPARPGRRRRCLADPARRRPPGAARRHRRCRRPRSACTAWSRRRPRRARRRGRPGEDDRPVPDDVRLTEFSTGADFAFVDRGTPVVLSRKGDA